jgi:fructokinase
MRQSWERDRAELALDAAALARLLDPAFPGATIASVEPVPGGLINTNLKIRLRDRPAPVLLRVYQRDAEEGLKEVALMRRFATRVPVPEVLHDARTNPVTGHAYSILGWVDGVDLHALALAGGDLRAAGRMLGTALARVHAEKFERFGYLGADLKLTKPIDLDRDGLLFYLNHMFAAGPGAARLGAELMSALVAFVEREGHLVTTWPGAPCLAHGDCNGSNLLFRQDAHRSWQLTAMLDWEFACSGTPGIDFGQLLRPPFVRQPTLADAAAAAYQDAGGLLPPDWRAVARITDLFAWTDIISRPDAGPSVIADARSFFAAIVNL